MINICRTTMVILVALAFGACGMMGSSNDGMSSQPSRNVVKSQPGAEMKVGDASPEARLLGFLNLANKDDLEGGRLAQERGGSMAVKTYGRQMESDHTQMLEDSESAAKRLDMLPAMGPETQPLIQDHAKALQKLQAASGKNSTGCICHTRSTCISVCCRQLHRLRDKYEILRSKKWWRMRAHCLKLT